MTRAGIVTVAGKPNAGKSTLLNRVMGEKLAIVSHKPQSTRDRVVGIHSAGDVQMIIYDTPGLLNPRYALQRSMRAAALEALADADAIIHVADVTEGPPPELITSAGIERPPPAPVLLALNKADTLSDAQRARLRTEHPDAFLISAVSGEGVDELIAAAASHLPESPFLYPDDEISTHTVRFFVSEMIRETALEQLEDEVPYSVACEIEEYREDRVPLYIRAVIFVERDSQKGILIGAKGQRLRDIGRQARLKIEAFTDARVYLDLWVKVLPNWRRNERSLKRFGYQVPDSPSP
ncbi:MAG: GTPase Era [Gemmatimonadaceae bacterium]|nr:GTPase Era [Gemmatimonadaceae bacterium]